jgi:altronate hydrolase
MKRAVHINPADNVAVAIKNIAAGETVVYGGKEITAVTDIPAGHKIAVADIPVGTDVIKYGSPIGSATRHIAKGEHAHTFNIKTKLEGEEEYTYEPVPGLGCDAYGEGKALPTFNGFRRNDGKAGIRNEIWIIPTVGCVNGIGAIIASKAQKFVTGSIDGVYCVPHPYGCSQLGGDHENTKKALCGMINHPNAGAVLVLGLGCENNPISGIKAALGEWDDKRVKFVNCQDEDDEIETAVNVIEELATYAGGFNRESIPAFELIVGLKCGGSDGFSGITANPLVGAFTDRLTGEGGTAILTEVPEMFGAERILFNRCINKEVFNKAVSMINGFKAYFISHGQPVYENPSPGNKAGGITTLEDKSLGCTQKAGSAAVTDVLAYGQAVTARGLNLLNAPGNDLVASTALAVSGAQIILFTTGRGTPFGSPVPTIKIASNTPMAEKKKSWIDFDAGGIVNGESINELADTLYDYVIRAANGEEQTKAEQHGARDMVIFKNGVTL